MLTAEELMKGNIVLFNQPGKEPLLLKVLTVCQYGCDVTYNSNAVKGAFAFVRYEHLQGIPVEYSFLINHFFFIDPVNNKAGCRLSLNSVDELCYYRNENKIRYQTKGSGFTRDYEIKTIHQLQNLYRIIAEKPLPYKDLPLTDAKD